MNRIPDRIVVLSLGVACAALISNLFITPAHAQIVSTIERAPNATAGNAASQRIVASTQAAYRAAHPPMLEMHVANNGLMLLRGARITYLQGTMMRVVLTWGSADFTWTIVTDGETRYFDSGGDIVDRTSFRVGDVVSVTGMLSASVSNPYVRGQYIRHL